MNIQRVPKYDFKRGFVAAAGFLIIALFLLLLQWTLPVSASEISVQPNNPNPTVASNTHVVLSSKVHGAQPHEYEMFWATGNGQWNRMSTNANSGISTAKVDTSGWNWSKDNTYPIRFIALIKSTQQSVEKSITLHKYASAHSVNTRKITTAIAAPTMSLPKLAASERLFADNDTVAAQEKSKHNDAAVNYISSQSTAKWFGGWNSDVAGDVSAYMQRAEAAQSTPVLVLYNIPNRDCGSYSAGGASSYQAYRQWVDQIAASINGRKAIVIVEPDALADMTCLSDNEKTLRREAIANAITTLSAPQVKTYIDAGNPTWKSPQQIAKELNSAGIANATGFSLNVSNFQTTDSNVAYGTTVSKLVGDKHFVIDTSRNGKGPAKDDEWCNPSGRGLGAAPTLSTNKALVDAYLWIKAPGESDGACGNSAPVAGEWWQSYAESLYENRTKN